MDDHVPLLLERELDYHFFNSNVPVRAGPPAHHRDRTRALSGIIGQTSNVVTPRRVLHAGTSWAPWRTRVDPNPLAGKTHVQAASFGADRPSGAGSRAPEALRGTAGSKQGKQLSVVLRQGSSHPRFPALGIWVQERHGEPPPQTSSWVATPVNSRPWQPAATGRRRS